MQPAGKVISFLLLCSLFRLLNSVSPTSGPTSSTSSSADLRYLSLLVLIVPIVLLSVYIAKNEDCGAQNRFIQRQQAAAGGTVQPLPSTREQAGSGSGGQNDYDIEMPQFDPPEMPKFDPPAALTNYPSPTFASPNRKNASTMPGTPTADHTPLPGSGN